jgi:D-3-phosphoglycerate dehydrogenase
MMKNDVGIVNCARGGVIDEVALVKALDSGKVLFAGLDVFENEPSPEMPILIEFL